MANAVYWVGQDNNIWYKAPDGAVSNWGAASNYQTTGDGIRSVNFDTPLGQGAGFAYATQIDDPNPGGPVVKSYVDDRTGSTGGSSYSPEDLAFLDSQAGLLREMLGRTDTSLNQGLAGLEDSYNKEQSRANARQSEALSGYATNRDDTLKDKQSAFGKVDTNARTLADSIRRILGMAAGRGSHNEVANYAVARQASQQRSGVQDTFGRNLRNIDTAESKTKTAFEELLADLLEQKRSKESGLRAGVEEQRIGLETSLANIAAERAKLLGGGYAGVRVAQQPYLDSIRNRNSSIDSLFERFRSPYSVRPVEVAAADMSPYQVDRQKLNANRQMGSNVNSPYAQFLMRQQQEDEERVV